MPHLLVDISSHGYGHVSQTAPVVNELARRIPDLRITLRTAAPYELLRRRFECEFEHVPVAFDFGMQMANAVDVQVEESTAAYQNFHADWQRKVEREAHAMRQLEPDLLLANVPYLSLAAAHAAGVRAVAMCSLNWADIYRHYCVRDDASAAIHAQMLEAYNSAACFLKLQPCMPMDDLRNTRSIGPVAQLGHNRRTQLKLPSPAGGRGVGGEGATEKLILVAMGGMEFRLPMENWPQIPGVRWLVPPAWGIERGDITPFESFGLPFSDVLASCDAVLTKPGYGTFVEAACAGVPVMYLARKDWPEEPYLTRWLAGNGVCREVERASLQDGDLADVLCDLWERARPPLPVATGVEEAVKILTGMLSQLHSS